MIEIDGSYLEGGGSIARVAMALSVLTGKEFKVTKIRSGRKQPGLKAQHLMAIKALKEICDAETNPVDIGSTELIFKPGKLKKGIFEIDIGTAGSTSLVLQTIYLPLAFAQEKSRIVIMGGTHVPWSPTHHYLSYQWLYYFFYRCNFHHIYPLFHLQIKFKIF